MSCIFCKYEEIETIKEVIFFDEGEWIAFPSVPYHTRGHTILAAKPKDGKCPRTTDGDWTMVETLGPALKKVAECLVSYYQPKDLLFSSLRGSMTHFHCHLIPLWDCEEKAWRKERLYEGGRLMEYLGDLEKRGLERAALERCQNGWDEAKQRDAIGKRLEPDIKELRSLTGYRGR